MRGAAGKQNTFAHRLLQISLERAPWHIRGDCLERLQVSFRLFHEIDHQSLLACIETILRSHYIGPDDPLAPLSQFVHLCGQAFDEVIEPPGQIHAAFSHALQRRIETSSVAVVKLTDRE